MCVPQWHWKIIPTPNSGNLEAMSWSSSATLAPTPRTAWSCNGGKAAKRLSQAAGTPERWGEIWHVESFNTCLKYFLVHFANRMHDAPEFSVYVLHHCLSLMQFEVAKCCRSLSPTLPFARRHDLWVQPLQTWKMLKNYKSFKQIHRATGKHHLPPSAPGRRSDDTRFSDWPSVAPLQDAAA